VNELALFAGAGGGILGGKLLGWRTVCAVEIEPYARAVLIARQDDGCLDPFPIWDDIRTFDGTPWRGVVDIVTGGFPCQDISVAGKGAGLGGQRSGLWSEMGRVIGEIRPSFVLVENSPVLTSRGLGVVLGDLASMGYDARWGVISAADAIWLNGAPCLDQLRERIWILAYPSRVRRREGRPGRPDSSTAREPEQSLSDANAHRVRELQSQGREPAERRWVGNGGSPDADACCGRFGKSREGQIQQPWRAEIKRGGWWTTEPDVVRMVHGVPNGVDRLRCLGNGQVPAVAALAWRILAGK
jgi:DNA (cytosine-5)-methyltransferase 1